MKGKLIIFSAPSGSGKTTIVRQLLNLISGLEFSISATSRAPRENEADGKDYYFITPDEFRTRINNDEFIEWEEVYENQYYGTLRSEIERIWHKNHHVIFDIDVQGGINLKNKFGENALSIFVKPPSSEVLTERLKSRGTESPESLKKRIIKAEYEISFSDQFDMVIINDDLERAVSEAVSIVNEFIRS